VTNCKRGVSSWDIRALQITQKTAWFMVDRIRLAMQDDKTGGKFDGQVEVDETFIGGKYRNIAANGELHLSCNGAHIEEDDASNLPFRHLNS